MTLRPTFIALTLAAFTALSAGTAQAAPRVDQRQHQQADRIGQGVASGQLTARETHHLARQQQQIARYERHARADGVLSLHERRHLRGLQASASRDIRQQKHDRQARHWR